MLARYIPVISLAIAASSVSAQSLAPAVGTDSRQSVAPNPSTVTRTNSPLTLEDILGLAAQSNPAFRGARADADASTGTFIQAGARPNPELSFLQEGSGNTERTTTALLNQTIELGGKRRARLDVASYGREVALATLDGRAAALRSQIIAAFYGLLAAQRQQQVAAETAAIAARSADLADKRSRAGKVSPVEATRAKVAASGAQIELANATTRVSTAAEKLATATGDAALREHAVIGDLESIPAVEPLSLLLARIEDSPLSRASKAEMMRSHAAISVERAKRIPDVTVSAGMKHVVTGGVPFNQAVIGVSIPLPIFDTNKGALLEAVHRAEKASADFDNEKAALRLELTQTYASYKTAKHEAERLKSEVLPTARDALDATSRGYELGKFAFLDVLDAQRTLSSEQSRYVQALTDAHLAYADLGRLMGTPLPSLASPISTQR
ncbi:TolC family protein [Paraburkholderia rhizosphaerae]|uniref:Cobalt-zinc-cadmium efflux system outer membrane protein n=1 Tax=Paraburkholderia rhizosphaerae TaxID=480658 RepID=A0A4V3HCT1_9BURK|nr:TolC family protein [Paraburkholderia rhizosphaerae]TDY38304.1 cobalt-zinc-cadmium efflux system outer membrane protein [Paraburkholderia rhizosphaerae]